MPVIESTTLDKQSFLYRMRHSLSHVMAQAVQKIYPGTLLGFGPPVDDGFYYDFLLAEGVEIREEDLPAIEAEMRRVLADDQRFERTELDADEALEQIRRMKEPHKLEYAQELIKKKLFDRLSFYKNGPFIDMCEGPHVVSTGELPPAGFKLYSVAGAYWRGDEKRVMLTRLYAYAYPTRAELEERIEAVRQARERDHRKLGQELRIYTVSDEVGKGLPLWLPNGTAIRYELERLAHEMEFRAGYKFVATPHITKAGLYHTSGHLPLYEDVMYPPMRFHEDAEAGGSKAESGDGEMSSYYLKPMNCPHHHMIYAADPRSYRDLPLRLSEYGTVYRFERSGQLQGLTRVRGMSMNDAHIYVTPDQLKDEFKNVMRLHQKYYDLFGFRNYFLRLSLWNPEDPKRSNKYFDDPEAWDYTQKVVQAALEELDLDYTLAKGEAAFYGPKVDFQFSSVIEREFTVSTNQLDFAVPPRFGLRFTGRDGREATPYCIHRAPLGTHERFIAFLIEHYGGAFPTWLSPVQVAVVPVSEKFLSYARKVEDLLRDRLVRVEVDDSDAKVGKKVRNALVRKIPLLAIVGQHEQEGSTVTLRRYGIEKQVRVDLASFLEMLDNEVRQRRHVQEW